MSNLVVVSQTAFFAYVGPRDIVLRSERDATYWETRNRTVVGMTTPGYASIGPRTYRLTEAALKDAGGRA